MKKADVFKILALLIIFGGGVWFSYDIVKKEPKLPIFNPVDLIPEVVPDSLRGVGLDFRVGPFNLIDHHGQAFTEESLRGRIYVTEFFFTTCPSICKDMSAQMRRVQEAFADDDKVHLVSHTVMPEVDSVSVLAEYAARQGAMNGKWHYLTGKKNEIYRMARTQYFAVRDGQFEGSGNVHDFIHTENFVLVDPRKRLRGFYDGTDPEDVDRLIEDIHILKKEFP
jgi:protein SCO1/2